MADLPKSLRQQLEENFNIGSLSLEIEQVGGGRRREEEEEAVSQSR